MAALSSFSFFTSGVALLVFTSCLPSLADANPDADADDGLKKEDWVRVGQCMLDCKQINTTCFQYCVTSAQQRRLTNYTGSTVETMWTFPDPGVIIDWGLTENSIVYQYPEPDTAKTIGTSGPTFVFLLLGESQEKDIWQVQGWSITTSMARKSKDICNHSLLAISTQGLLAVERIHCKPLDMYGKVTLSIMLAVVLVLAFFSLCIGTNNKNKMYCRCVRCFKRLIGYTQLD